MLTARETVSRFFPLLFFNIKSLLYSSHYHVAPLYPPPLFIKTNERVVRIDYGRVSPSRPEADRCPLRTRQGTCVNGRRGPGRSPSALPVGCQRAGLASNHVSFADTYV